MWVPSGVGLGSGLEMGNKTKWCENERWKKKSFVILEFEMKKLLCLNVCFIFSRPKTRFYDKNE